MTPDTVILSGRIRLARNYADLPFPNRNRENPSLCVERARAALEPKGYALSLLPDLSESEKLLLKEEHLITPDLLKNQKDAAVLLRADRSVSVLVNEEDHLRVLSVCPGVHLREAYAAAAEAEELLAAVSPFSFHEQLGYLTATPTSTGTGMRASLLMHLPMLTAEKKMGEITQNVAKLGLTIRGVYGEGSEALGDLYQLSNQITLGRTEEEILEAVEAVAQQLKGLEEELRGDMLEQSPAVIKDMIFRSYGLCRYSYRMELKEFYSHWSHLRLGAARKLFPIGVAAVDHLLCEAQDGHLAVLARDEESLPQTRSRLLRGRLGKKTPQEQ